MGKEKKTAQSKQDERGSTSVEETALGKQFNELLFNQFQQGQPGLQAGQEAGFNLFGNILRGEELPGFLQGLPGGISPDVTSGIVQESLGDVNAQLQQAGVGTFLESGAAQQAGVRTAGDIRRQSAQFNIQNLMQLLGLGAQGQAQQQQTAGGFSQLLGNQLAGLRGGAFEGTQFGTGKTVGPSFGSQLGSSFAQSAGTTLGSPSFNAGGFKF